MKPRKSWIILCLKSEDGHVRLLSVFCPSSKILAVDILFQVVEKTPLPPTKIPRYYNSGGITPTNTTPLVRRCCFLPNVKLLTL